MKTDSIFRNILNISIPVILAGMLVLGISGCNSSGKKKGTEQQTVVQKRSFTPPSVPEMLQDPAERAAYVVTHYWDNFDFSDTLYVDLPDVTEQAFADFINILNYADNSQAVKAINGMLSKAEAEETGRMYDYFLEMSEKYLYDPNSPFRNEEYYIAVVHYILGDNCTSELEKSRPERRLEMMLKNRPGDVAADFVYTLESGRTGRLHNIKSDYTLLLFNNPDCTACLELKDQIEASPVITALVEGGKMTIMAIYPDEDIAIWLKHLDKWPKGWITAYDNGTVIKNEKLYELRAIPTMYLLDRDKRVILKDPVFQMVEEVLVRELRVEN